MALPTFSKLGTKLSTPSWLSATGNELYFPRLFNNDAHRANLPGLPASKYSVLYSSDHAGGTGYIGRVDFDDIEGAWTDHGSAIHSGGAQRETPHPVYDPANNRVNVYVHDVTSNVPNGSQQTRLLTTTDLTTLTDQGPCVDVGYHSGYAYAERLGDGTWRMLHGYHSPHDRAQASWIRQVSESTDGTNFSVRGATLHTQQQHILGDAKLGIASYFAYGGQRYVCAIRTKYPVDNHAHIAFPVADDWTTPIGGYYVLIERDGTGSNEAKWPSGGCMVEIGGVLYLIYVGQDSGGGQHIMLAKGDGAAATVAAPTWAVFADGRLERHTSGTSLLNWDAINEPPPAGITIQARQGTNNSAHVDGSYYELKGGTSSNEVVEAKTDAAHDPSQYETLDYEWRGLTFTSADIDALGIQLFVKSHDAVPWDGALLYWQSGADTSDGELRLYQRDVSSDPVASHPTRMISYGVDGVAEWARGVEFDLRVRVHDYGRRLTVFANGSVAYHRSLTADVAWSNSLHTSLRVRGSLSGFAPWARILGLTITGYQIAAPTSLAATSPSSGQIDLTWTDPEGSQLDRIDVYRSTTSGSGYTKISGAGGVAIGTESYSDTSAVDGTTYYYVVRAVDQDGEVSADSNEASGTAGPEPTTLFRRTPTTMRAGSREAA